VKDWKEFLEEAKKHIPENIECEIKMISSINSLTRFLEGVFRRSKKTHSRKY